MTGRRAYPKWLVRGLVIFAIGMTVFAAVASREHHAAENARNATLSRLVALEARNLQGSDPALGMQLALVAYRLAQTTEARSALLDATAGEMPTRLIGRPGQTALALGDDGHRVAIAHRADDLVTIYELRYAQLSPLATLPGSPRAGQVEAVALSDSGRLLATGDQNGQVTLWSLASPRHPKRLAILHAGRGAVHGLSFSPPGGSLAAADADGHVQRWSLADPALPSLAAPLSAPGVAGFEAVSYSHGGRTVAAVGAGGALVVWAAHRGTRPLATFAIGGATLTAVAYSPDGRLLAVGNQYGGVDLRTLSARGIPAPSGKYLTTSGRVTWLSFSRDSRYLAAGTTAKSAPILSTAPFAEVADLPHPSEVTGVAFTAGDRHLLSTDTAGTAMIWQFPAPSTYTFGSSPSGVSYSTTTPRLAVTTASGRVDQWDVVDEWRPAPVGAWYAAPVSDAPPHAYWMKTNTTRTTATATKGSALTVNPHAGDEALRRTRAVTNVITSVLSPDGQLRAAGGEDRLVWLWDISDPASPQLVAKLTGFTAGVTSVLFSGNSKTLFAGSLDHTVRIWSLAKPTKPQELPSSPLIGPSTAITTMVLSPDNRALAVATVDGRVWLWGVATPAKAGLMASLFAARGQLTALSFSPSDNVLVAGGSSRRLTFWHWRPYQAVNRVCALAGTPITASEWNLYGPGAPYRPPCAKWSPPASAKRGS